MSSPISSLRRLPARTRLASRAGLATAALSRRLGTGEGSVIGGRVTLALDPAALHNLAAGRIVALVSGTNGKTTTTSMLAAALGTLGPVVSNSVGSNMFGGMAGALNGSEAGIAVLETDEAHLPQAIAQLSPRLLLLMNLSRDQLDRVGEVRTQAAKWRDALQKEKKAIVVANADDPMVVWAAQSANTVIWVEGGCAWRHDASSCPECGAQVQWDADDNWHCQKCHLKRPVTHARYTADQSQAGDVRVPVQLKIPGEINRSNAVMALVSAAALGADPWAASQAVAQLESPGGRFTKVKIAGVDARLILAKNPAGWTEALRIASGDAAVVVAINARVQDGRDPSWLWDVPFEELAGRFAVATGERARDVSVRLKYAGVKHDCEPDLAAAVAKAGEHRNGHVVDVIGNYSTFQDYRVLGRS